MPSLLRRIQLLLLTSLIIASVATVSAEAPRPRLITLGSTVSEMAVAVGAGSDIVAVDQSSAYPATELDAKPRLGYYRALSAEGVLSFRPSLVLASAETGPPPVVAQLRQAGIPFVPVTIEHSEAGCVAAIRSVAKALGRESAGEELAARVSREVADARASIPTGSSPRVVFIYARGGGVLNVGGAKTAADAMIALAGGVNAVDGFDGFRALTPEALVAARPDVILMTTGGLEALGGVQKVRQLPALALTPAARNGKIVAMDDQLLLGFGPRLGFAIRELAELIHEGGATE